MRSTTDLSRNNAKLARVIAGKEGQKQTTGYAVARRTSFGGTINGTTIPSTLFQHLFVEDVVVDAKHALERDACDDLVHWPL